MENLAEYCAAHRTRERGNEDGSVRLAKTKKVKKWEGVYHVYVDNVRHTRYRIIGECSKFTKTQARNEHREWLRRLHSQPVADTSKATVGQLLEDFYLLKLGDWAKQTRDTMRALIDNGLKPALGNKALEDVTAEDLKVFINSLPSRKWTPKTKYIRPDGSVVVTHSKESKSGCSVSYVKKSITVLRAVFDLAVERNLIRKNPARSITTKLTVPKTTRAIDKSVFAPTQLPALLAELERRDSLIVWLSIIAATRPNELFALTGGDVGPDYIYVRQALDVERQIKTTKTERPRKIALPPELAADVNAWLVENNIGKDDLVFRNVRNKAPIHRSNYLRRVLRPAAKRAKIATSNVDFRMLRRSFATIANAIGFDVKSIQAQLGHAQPTMTLGTYIQPVDALRLEQIKRFEDILRGRIPMPHDIAMNLGTDLVQ